MMGWDDALILALISMGTTAAASAMTPTPENKMTTTGVAAGGQNTSQAQDLFAMGQPNSAPVQLPPVSAPPSTPGPEIGALLAQAPVSVPNSPMPTPENTKPPFQYTPGMGQTPAPMNVPMSPSPAAVGVPGAKPSPKLGDILTTLGQSADILAKLSPMLGFGQQEDKRLVTGSPAGGSAGGQNIFALPQRATLAQILASLPRTM